MIWNFWYFLVFLASFGSFLDFWLFWNFWIFFWIFLDFWHFRAFSGIFGNFRHFWKKKFGPGWSGCSGGSIGAIGFTLGHREVRKRSFLLFFVWSTRYGGPQMIGVLRGTQPVSLDGLGRVLRFWSRFLRLSGDCHLRLFSSGQPGMGGMGSPVQWFRTFFGLQIDKHDQRNPTVPSVSL